MCNNFYKFFLRLYISNTNDDSRLSRKSSTCAYTCIKSNRVKYVSQFFWGIQDGVNIFHLFNDERLIFSFVTLRKNSSKFYFTTEVLIFFTAYTCWYGDWRLFCLWCWRTFCWDNIDWKIKWRRSRAYLSTKKMRMWCFTDQLNMCRVDCYNAYSCHQERENVFMRGEYCHNMPGRLK